MKNMAAMLLVFFIAVCPTPICAAWLDEVETDPPAPSETDSRNLIAVNSNEDVTNEELFHQIVNMVQGVDLKFESGSSSGGSDCANYSDKCEEPKNVEPSRE